MTKFDRQKAEDHLLVCPDCLEVWAAWVGEVPDITPEVMTLTGVDPCQQALDELGNPCSVVDKASLAGHLAHCSECGAVNVALAALGKDLPELRDVEPDSEFVHDVMVATVNAPVPTTFLTELYARWIETTRRPRFAMELAYVFGMFLVLIVGIDHFSAPISRRSLAQAETFSTVLSDLTTQADQQMEKIGGGFVRAVDVSLQESSHGCQRVMAKVSTVNLQFTSLRNQITQGKLSQEAQTPNGQ
jgi:hypothetical protein